MPTVVCHHCSEIFTVDGPKPDQCPSCGRTLHIEGDPTPTGPALHSTIIQLAERKPTAFGRYVVQSRLGAGGFGSVFLAKDPQLDRLVAIKVPRGETGRSPLGLERFAREGRNIAQLRHPGIVSVFNVELDGELPFIVCEYVEGETLSDHMRKAPLSFREAARLIADVAAAVDYAHECGIIHRDIKPSNIMIAADGKPRLMDFGLAKREAIDNTVTSDHAILGTPAYMSPEQAWGRKRGPVDRRSDIYSLGTVLYQVLTRELPFRGEPRMVLRQVIEDDPKSPRTLNAEIPRDLETICEKAMQKEPGSRYQTARALADDLENWLTGRPIEAQPPTRLGRSWRWCRRNPAAAGLICAVLLLLLTWGVGSSVMAAVAVTGRKEAVGRQQAEKQAREVAENGRNEAIAAKKREAELRALEAAARQEAEKALRENRELLSRAYGERGERHMRVAETSVDFDPISSLPWFLQTMKFDEKNPERLRNDRIRLQTLLDSAPAVERMWFFNGQVTASGLSPKRDSFFIAGQDGTAKIWKIAGDAPPVVIPNPASVSAAAFSPDGTRLATSSVDGLRIWATDSGKCLHGPLIPEQVRFLNPRLTSGPNDALIAFSKSGRFAFTSVALPGGISQVWDAESGQPVGKTIVTAARVQTAEFADSDRLLVLNHGTSTHVYDVQTSAEKASLKRDKNSFGAARVSPDGHTIASCDASGGLVVLWNAITGKTIGQALTSDSAAGYTSSAFSRDGELFATGTVDGTVRVWNVAGSRLLWRRQVMQGRVDFLQFSADSSALEAAKLRQKICALASRDGRPMAEPISAAVKLNSVDWLTSPDQIVAIDIRGVARLWHLESQIPAFPLPVVGPCTFAISADRRALAVAEPTTSVSIFQSRAGDPLDPSSTQRVQIGDLSSTAIALTGDGSRIAFAGERQVYIFETVSHKQVCGPLLHTGNVTQMQFTPDGGQLICVSYDGLAVVWDVATAKRLYEPLKVGMRPTDIDVDREGKLAAVAASQGVTVWELASGKQTHNGSLGGNVPLFARFVGDPAHILIVAPSRATKIWDVRTGQCRGALPYGALAHGAYCIDVSVDKNKFLDGLGDGTARLWSAPDATIASPAFAHPSPVIVGKISPTGRHVLTITSDHDVFLWDASSAELLSVVSLRHLGSRFAVTDAPMSLQASEKPFAFFAPDNRAAYVVTRPGLFVTIDLQPDARSDKQIAAAVAIRSGAEFDGVGDLRSLEPKELAAVWATFLSSRPKRPNGLRIGHLPSRSEKHSMASSTGAPSLSR